MVNLILTALPHTVDRDFLLLLQQQDLTLWHHGLRLTSLWLLEQRRLVLHVR